MIEMGLVMVVMLVECVVVGGFVVIVGDCMLV